MTALLLPPVVDTVSIDLATRREFLTLLGAAGLLAGCATGSAPPPAPATQPFVDGRGTTVDVPVRPQRIVTTQAYLFGGALLSLGAPLVGMTDDGTGTFYPYVTDQYDTTGVAPIGTNGAIDVEAIAALTPDLIIGSYLPDDTTYNGDPDALAAIAPTVLLSDSVDVDTLMEQLGRLSGLPQRVTEQRDRWRARLTEVRGSASARGLTAVHVRYTQGGPVELFTPIHPSSITRVLAQVGVGTLPFLQDAADAGEAFFNLTAETVGQLNADLVIWYAGDGALDPSTIPTWAALPAAAAGQVVREDPARNSLVCYDGYLETVDYLAPILARTAKVT